MDRSAQVENMVVVNVIVGTVPGSIPCPEWVAPGDTFDGVAFHAAQTAPETESAKRDGVQRLAWAKVVAASGGTEARARIEMARRAAPWVSTCVAIHTAMGALLAMNPIPDDYADNSYWP